MPTVEPDTLASTAASSTSKLRVGLVGLGKMGLSHCAIVRPHPRVDLAGICDTSGYVLSTLEKYTGIPGFKDFEEFLETTELDALVVATPSTTHASMVRSALERGLHVFCEKPFTLTPEDALELTELARARGVVNQVGYHNRFVGAFREVKRLLDLNAIGEITHVSGEAYGPVVLKQKGSTWRTQSTAGGGCLYDYAAHVINLINWYIGEPTGVGGTVLNSIFSSDTDDEVFSTLHFPDGQSASLSVSWSDESHRRMTTKVELLGTAGRIYVDRQECRVYLRGNASVPDGYQTGWNVRYTTDLTEPVWFYLRGEEYSAQIDAFVTAALDGDPTVENDFASAAETDRVIALMIADSRRGPATLAAAEFSDTSRVSPAPAGGWWSRWRARRRKNVGARA